MKNLLHKFNNILVIFAVLAACVMAKPAAAEDAFYLEERGLGNNKTPRSLLKNMPL